MTYKASKYEFKTTGNISVSETAGCSTASTVTVTEDELQKAIMDVMYLERSYDTSQCISGASSKIWRQLGGKRP
jgi:hypothetical protein